MPTVGVPKPLGSSVNENRTFGSVHTFLDEVYPIFRETKVLERFEKERPT